MLEAKVSVTESAATWMTKRLEEMRKGLVASEHALQEFREREQLVDVDGLRALPSAEITELSSRLVEVRQQLSTAEIAYNQVSKAGPGGSSLQSIPAVLDDAGVRAFQDALAQSEQQVAELAKRYGPKHPRMIAAQAELELARNNYEQQRTSVADRIRREYEAERDEEQALVAALERARSEYQTVGRKESELNALQRAVETNRELYNLFYNRASETAATSDLQSVQARIVETAVVPVEPVKPRQAMIVGGAFVGMLVLGLAVAFVSDGLSNTLRGARDVEEKLGQTLLAMVPALDEKDVKKYKSGIIEDPEYSEAIRTLRTGIMLDSTDRPHKIVLVTSSVSGEGKSTVALNLAASFAKSGRVLIIDADMRRPSIGTLLGMPRYDAGLSELITKAAVFKACLARTVVPNLHVIRTGFIPADPLQLLAHRRMTKTLRVLSQYYDHIVIDSPPILPVSDAAVLSKYADAVVFVAKADDTPVPQIENGINLLRRVNAQITGIVLNRLDTKKARKYSDFGYGGYYESYSTQA
jgi:capsular exopolysaccharide synthesis family protein